MIEQNGIGPVSQDPNDDPDTRKTLEQRKAEEDKRREAEKKTPGVTRNRP